MRGVADRGIALALAASFLVIGAVRGADDKLDVTGKWKGHYKNTAGGKDDNSKLVLEEYKKGNQTLFKGHWDNAAIERGIRKGNKINWVHLNNKDNKIYTVNGTISADGKTIHLEYTVKKKEGNKPEYTGNGTYQRCRLAKVDTGGMAGSCPFSAARLPPGNVLPLNFSHFSKTGQLATDRFAIISAWTPATNSKKTSAWDGSASNACSTNLSRCGPRKNGKKPGTPKKTKRFVKVRLKNGRAVMVAYQIYRGPKNRVGV